MGATLPFDDCHHMTRLKPDLSYHIDAVARASLQPGVDPDALERLLQYVPAESRASHLEMFSVRHTVVDADGRAPDVTTLDRISEPMMQSLLEEVWQPFGPRSRMPSWNTVPAGLPDASSLAAVAPNGVGGDIHRAAGAPLDPIA